MRRECAFGRYRFMLSDDGKVISIDEGPGNRYTVHFRTEDLLWAVNYLAQYADHGNDGNEYRSE